MPLSPVHFAGFFRTHSNQGNTATIEVKPDRNGHLKAYSPNGEVVGILEQVPLDNSFIAISNLENHGKDRETSKPLADEVVYTNIGSMLLYEASIKAPEDTHFQLGAKPSSRTFYEKLEFVEKPAGSGIFYNSAKKLMGTLKGRLGIEE
ncbi:MAG: hypothetical protein QE263_09475 [Vampirovibrionales bacterium]|nr:hypothetical protein [Vampirovibrionales bacterium]